MINNYGAYNFRITLNAVTSNSGWWEDNHRYAPHYARRTKRFSPQSKAEKRLHAMMREADFSSSKLAKKLWQEEQLRKSMSDTASRQRTAHPKTRQPTTTRLQTYTAAMEQRQLKR